MEITPSWSKSSLDALRKYRPAPGSFDAWYDAEGQHLQLDTQDLIARQASVLEAALADLDPAIFQFLCQIAAFRYPVDYAALIAINPFNEPLRGEHSLPPPAEEGGSPKVPGRTEAEPKLTRLHHALSELEERGLVQWDRGQNRYDLHPVVRNFAYGRLESKTATLAQLRNYFAALPSEDENQVRDVADLRRTLELYHTLVESGLLDEAYQLYRERLDPALYFGLGTYTTIVELLTPLFPHGLSELPALSVPAQGSAANDLGAAFGALEDWTQARKLLGLCLHLALQNRVPRNVTAPLDNLSTTILREGRQLAVVERLFQLLREVALAAYDRIALDVALSDSMMFYAIIGAWDAGEAALGSLTSSPDDTIKRLAYSYVNTAYLQFGQDQDPTATLEEAIRVARRDRHLKAERDAQRLLGEAALSRDDLAQAEEAWQVCYSIAQQQGVPLGPCLADLARLRVRQGNTLVAQDLIAEALASGGLHVALAAAEVYLALGDTAQAKHHIYPAYKEAWADGPPYAFVLELTRARAVLEALYLPEPELPPFDPAKVPQYRMRPRFVPSSQS